MDLTGNVTFLYNDTDRVEGMTLNTTFCERCVQGNRNLSRAIDYKPPDQSHIKYITLAFYLCTFVFGIIGNTLVLYVIARFSAVRKRSVANYYIWNLALSDEIYIFALPWFCFTTYTSNWIFGDVLCKVAFVIRECNKFASVFTLMALSVDRYLATYHNLGRYRTIKVGKIVCLAIWIMCLISSTPYIMYSYTVVRRGRTSCELNWPAANHLQIKRIWTYTQLVIGYVLPLLVIITASASLLWRVKSMVKPGAGGGNKNKKTRSNSSMMKTVLVVVGIFMICQLPYHVMEIVSLRVLERTIQHGTLPTRTEVILFVHFNMMSQILVFISSCCNPIIYGVFNTNFRNLYKQVLCCGYFANRTSGQNGEYSKVQASVKCEHFKCCVHKAPERRQHICQPSADTTSNCKLEAPTAEIELTSLKNTSHSM